MPKKQQVQVSQRMQVKQREPAKLVTPGMSYAKAVTSNTNKTPVPAQQK